MVKYLMKIISLLNHTRTNVIYEEIFHGATQRFYWLSENFKLVLLDVQLDLKFISPGAAYEPFVTLFH